MRFQEIEALLLLLLLLSGCNGISAAPPAEADEEGLSAAALFQTENGTLQCTRWLTRTLPPNAELPQKGV